MIQGHDWTNSRLGHGRLMCKRCQITDTEAEALGLLHDCYEGMSLDPLDEIEDCFMPKQAAAGRPPVPTRKTGKSEHGAEPVGGGGANLPLWLMSLGLALSIIAILKQEF